ncbi:hypothetical protein ACX4MZ_21470 [Roseomonas mucosa]
MLYTVADDSLAVGVAASAPQCEALARVGIGTGDYLRTFARPIGGDRVVISLGVNDGPGAATLENLAGLRGCITARDVFWLLPGQSDRARHAIQRVAAAFRDRLIDTRPAVRRDHLHLTRRAYWAVAQLTVASAP